jgi:hypothetical protein
MNDIQAKHTNRVMNLHNAHVSEMPGRLPASPYATSCAVRTAAPPDTRPAMKQQPVRPTLRRCDRMETAHTSLADFTLQRQRKQHECRIRVTAITKTLRHCQRELADRDGPVPAAVFVPARNTATALFASKARPIFEQITISPRTWLRYTLASRTIIVSLDSRTEPQPAESPSMRALAFPMHATFPRSLPIPTSG